MTLPLNLSPTVKLARSTAVRAVVDAATLPGKLQLFAPPRVDPGQAPAAPPLAEITLTKPSGAVDESGYGITQAAAGQVATSGDIAWGRVVNGDGAWVIDADAGLAATPIVLDNTTVYAGGFVSIVSSLLTEGG